MTITTEEANWLADWVEEEGGLSLRAAGLRSLAAERDALKAAINEALTEELPIEGWTWSQEPIGPNETPGEAIRRLIKHRVKTGRDALQAENARLREALRLAIDAVEFWAAYASPYFQDKHDLAEDLQKLRAALGEKDNAEV